MELRNKLTLVPHQLPEPPPPASTNEKSRLVIRLAGVAVVTAVGVIGYRLGSAPTQNQLGLTLQRLLPGAPSSQSTPLPSASPPAARATLQSDEQKSRDAAPSRGMSGRLTVGAAQPQQMDEAIRLTAFAVDAGADATVVVGGLVRGSTLSAGTQVGPTTWRLPAQELGGATITPPRGFVGAVDLTLELRVADNALVDRKSLRLEWSGPPAPKSQTRQLDANEIAQMVKSGAEYMANGSIGAARMIFQPAAEAGDPVAAFALAETYDPVVLSKLNTKGGITANVGLAQAWYQKAKDLGSVAARERLERLARVRE